MLLFALLICQPCYRQTTCAYMQVDELLTLDPGNAEYQDLHTSLLEVMCLYR